MTFYRKAISIYYSIIYQRVKYFVGLLRSGVAQHLLNASANLATELCLFISVMGRRTFSTKSENVLHIVDLFVECAGEITHYLGQATSTLRVQEIRVQ